MSDECFIDSNVWLYALVLRPGEEKRHATACRLIVHPARYVISEQVIAEVSSNLLHKAGMAEAPLQALVESFYQRCRVIAPGPALHRRGSGLRQRYRFSYWDSLIVAAALEAGCSTLYSEDMQHGLVVDEVLTVLNPFAASGS